MIKGTGIDIIEIKRIEAAISKGNGFIERIFNESEINSLKEKGFKASSIAGFFAAKEACLKALGTGLRSMKWKDIEICNDGLGKPYIILHNSAREIAYSQNISEILLSISHSREYAVAQAIAI
ncbi:MAG: holo-ACP synthase [Flavobacteriales bacterium]|nr:holo-ACP synthase [Flavobacteriales bacterium]